MSRRLCGFATPVAVAAVASLMSGSASGQAPSAGQPQASTGCPAASAAFHTCALERAKTFNPPRTPDGKPKLQGFWRAPVQDGEH